MATKSRTKRTCAQGCSHGKTRASTPGTEWTKAKVSKGKKRTKGYINNSDRLSLSLARSLALHLSPSPHSHLYLSAVLQTSLSLPLLLHTFVLSRSPLSSGNYPILLFLPSCNRYSEKILHNAILPSLPRTVSLLHAWHVESKGA